MGGIGVDYSDGRFHSGAGEKRGHGMHGIFVWFSVFISVSPHLSVVPV